jgi:hypothetical protein
MDDIGDAASGAVDAVGDAAGAVADTASDAASAVADAASSAAGAVADVASDAAGAVADAASSAASAVAGVAGDIADAASGLLDSILGKLHAAYDAVAGQISKAWSALENGAKSTIDAAISEVTGFLGGVGGFFAGIGSAIVNIDGEALRGAWNALKGGISTIIGGAKAAAARVMSWLDSGWNGLKGTAQGLIGGLRGKAEGLIAELPGPVQGAARSVWSKIESTANSIVSSIEEKWTKLRNWAKEKIDAVVKKAESLASAFADSVIQPIIDTFVKAGVIIKFLKQAFENPESLIQPMVAAITEKLSGLPAKANEVAASVLNDKAKGGGDAPAVTPAVAPGGTPAQRLLQRDAAKPGDPRSTLGVGTAISHVWDGLVAKGKKTWADLGKIVKDMVLSLVYPPATWKALKDDWTQMTTELSKRAARMEGVRTDSFDNFFEDIRRWISNLVDFPLIVWRGINAMLGRLSVYIGLAIILGGAIAGAIAAGTGGAVFGSVVPGAGTAGGGIAGVAAGAWAGAQAGYAAAEVVGLALLASFVVAEQVSIGKAALDLLTVPQTKDEQDEDVNQIADSAIAIGAAALLMAIAWAASALIKGLIGLAKSVYYRINPKAKPVVESPPEVKPPTDPAKGKASDIIICRLCAPELGITLSRMPIMRAVTCVPLKDVPPDLIARRTPLTPEGRRYFDAELGKTVKDPLNPTAAEFDTFRKFLDDAQANGGGNLDDGLKLDMKLNPGAEPPFGPAPDRAVKTLDFVRNNQGQAPPGHAGNVPFANDGRQAGHILPKHDPVSNRPVTYTEYDVKPQVPGVNRGGERIVVGDNGHAYYTSDHYHTFTRFR